MAAHHAEAAKALGHRITAAAARPGSKKLQEFTKRFNVAHSYENWELMLEREQLDALIVAAPWDQTETFISQVLAKGIPCLIEKPVALSSAKLREIMNPAQDRQDQIMVGYNRRFYDFIPVLKEVLASNSLISVNMNLSDPAALLVKKYGPEIAPHLLIYMSSHWYDLLTHLIGPVRPVQIKKTAHSRLPGVEHYDGMLLTQNGIPVHVISHFDAPSQTSITFHTEKEIHKLCPIETLTVYNGLECITEDAVRKINRYVPKVESQIQTDSTLKPGILKQMRNFLDSCVFKTAPREGCSLQDALNVTELCENIQTGGIPCSSTGK